MISPVDAGYRIGTMPDTWPGRCFEIASSFVHAGLVEGIAVYGHWRGSVHPDSFFAARRGLGWINHGWVLLPNGQVVDPTRWVFEAAEPYIYEGPNGDEYDEGGNVLMHERYGDNLPPPRIGDERGEVDLHIEDIDARNFVFGSLLDAVHVNEIVLEGGKLTGRPGILTIGKTQAWWLAHVHYDLLEGYAPVIYAAFADAGLKALIPIDNWDRSVRERA